MLIRYDKEGNIEYRTDNTQYQTKQLDFITMLKTSDINEFYIKEHLSKSLESTIMSQGFNKIETNNGYVRWVKE